MSQTRTFKAGVVASGNAFTVAVGILSSALLARLLSMHEYGTFRQTLLVFLVAGPILSLGLPNALTYFLPGETRRARAVLYENLLLLVGMGAAFGVFLLAGGNRLIARWLDNPDLVVTLAIMAPYAAFFLPWGSCSNCLMVAGRAVRYTVLNVLARLLLLACVLVPCLIWRTAEAAVAGTMLAAVLTLMPAFVMMVRACPGQDSVPHWAGMRAQLAYAGPLAAATIFAMLFLTLDKLIVAYLCDPSTYAIYANGAMELPIAGIVTGAATAILLPELVSLFKRGEPVAMLDLWRRSTVKCAVVIAPVMAGLLALAPQFIRLLYSSAYAESTLPFIVYLLVLPGRVANYSAMYIAAGRTGSLCVRHLLTLVVNAAISVTLVRQMGYMGAAVGAVLTLYLCEIPLNLHGIRRLVGAGGGALLPYGDLARIFAASLAAAVPVALLAQLTPLRDGPAFLLGGTLYAVLAALALQKAGYVDPRAAVRHLGFRKGLS